MHLLGGGFGGPSPQVGSGQQLGLGPVWDSDPGMVLRPDRFPLPVLWLTSGTVRMLGNHE
eukprot:5987567-Prymnesium_polylepis.1